MHYILASRLLPIVLAPGLVGLLATASRAVPPDYILLNRCLATADEMSPPSGAVWQPGVPFVHIQDAATGSGGWAQRHWFQFTAYAYENGPNGHAEYGTGDDVCLGVAAALPGVLTYEVIGLAPDAASGAYSLTESPIGNYHATDIAATIDQTFDLGGLTDIRLLFFHHHAMRWPGIPSDQALVEVNTGSGWQAVDPENSPAGDFYSFHLGDKHMFKRGEVDLSAFAGQPSVQIRFHFTANTANHDDGWFIDDVRLLGDGATLFFDDFELGTGQWILELPWGRSGNYSYSTGLGSIDQTGRYSVTPVAAPVTVGEGMGYNAVRATYTEGDATLRAYARVYHTGPLFVAPPDLGLEEICAGTVAVGDALAPIHERLALRQNSPNPFNPSTLITFRLSEHAGATLRIFDESGRLVRSLLAGAPLAPGEHAIPWDGRDDLGERLASGIYLYRLTVNDQTLARKMVMVR